MTRIFQKKLDGEEKEFWAGFRRFGILAKVGSGAWFGVGSVSNKK